MTRFALVTVAGASLLVGVVGATVTRPEDGHPAPPATVVAAPPPVSQTIHGATLLRMRPRCTSEAHPFDSVAISVAGVIRRAPVMTPPRDARGNVLLNAHTWPHGRALGNKLLAGLHPGGRVVAHGVDKTFLCYRVTKRVVVPADEPYWDYYARRGGPQLAIVVCSGPRLGPRNWATRTVWFASPHV